MSFFDKIKRNHLKEDIEKRFDKNMDIAVHSIFPKLSKTLFSGMILFSLFFFVGEYLDVRKAQSLGLERTYHISASINAAFYIWTFIGIFVLITCLFACRDIKSKLSHPEQIPITPPTKYRGDLAGWDQDEKGKELKELLRKEAILQYEQTLTDEKHIMIFTISGIVILGILYLIF